MKRFICPLVVVLFLAAGCAGTQKQLTKVEVYDKFESITMLNKKLQVAKEKEVDVFAPEGFLKAEALYNEALEMAREGRFPEQPAKKGLSVIAEAEADAKYARKVLWEVIQYRERARNAQAFDLFREKCEKAEQKLVNTCRLIESENITEAKEQRPSLIDLYNKVEIESLEKGVIDLARASFEKARSEDADDYAPQTFKRAQKELNLALSILDADRREIKKANAHGRVAVEMARKAVQVTELAKLFERREYSFEDIIVWYRMQLKEINKPLAEDLEFDQPNHLVVRSLRDTIESLVQSQKDCNLFSGRLQKRIDAQGKQIVKLNKKHESELSAQAKRQAELDRRKQEAEDRFNEVDALFTAKEATVYRKGDNVLIRAYGFYFPVGSAEIKTVNFGLMNKLITAIRTFPDSRINISGHTDATGGDKINLTLSQKRAENVAGFLEKVGHIKKSDISIKGYGKTKPVAGNETEKGRAKNRRIEILIVNK